MTRVTDGNNSSKTGRGLGRWRWLIEPPPSIVEPERRLQARLLMTMLLVLLVLGVLSVILTLFDLYTRSGDSKAITPILIGTQWPLFCCWQSSLV